MSHHLGERVTALVDGRLDPDAADRAHAHLASCEPCRQAVEAERLTKGRLAHLPGPAPGDTLTRRLLAMAVPGEPVPPRSRRVPGAPVVSGVRIPAAAFHPAGSRPPRRADGTRPRRRRWRPHSTRARALTAVAGALCLAGVAAVSLGAVGASQPPAVVPPVDHFVGEHAATTVNMPFGNPAGTGR